MELAELVDNSQGELTDLGADVVVARSPFAALPVERLHRAEDRR